MGVEIISYTPKIIMSSKLDCHLNDRHCQYILTTNDGCGKKVINSTIGKSNLFLSYFHT